MNLNSEQQRMLDGEFGPSIQWAIKFLVETGTMLGADSLIPIRYAFLMADTDAMGEAGINFVQELGQQIEQTNTMPRANLYLESRHTANELVEFGLPAWFVDLDNRRLEAISKIGCIMEFGHINNHSVPAPCYGEAIAMGSTPSAIYANSALGARTNFEAGPAALAAALAGYVPRWGLHLDENRVPQRAFSVERTPQSLTEWGALGAIVGQRLNNSSEIPIIHGIDAHPGALALNHFGAAIASYGAVGLFHVAGWTPEAYKFASLQLPSEIVSNEEISAFISGKQLENEPLDLVVFGAPQMGLDEIIELEQGLRGNQVAERVTMLAFSDKGTIDAAERLGILRSLEQSGCQLLDGIDYFQAGSEPIRQSNNWRTAITPSVKLSNILNGAGYTAAAVTINNAIQSAIAGKVIHEN
ncbi:DUF521 domain-containing protein [Photobacterium sanctipauli]|uniref:DUF521 domain-containing protein n=1 Tax=Photobacterium sanctipauli TaxID=1342794 RepID=A0A2T3NWG4_9GAMM|nr:aconitase X [Photobacterium sanctipauli]PSW20581.1 DUF521 domain-containing protein [Photobacterium sanctipauli]